MRIVIVGASKIAEATAHQLIDKGHQVTFIERDKARIDSLSEELDCGFLLGDGSSPDLLREAGAEHTDVLFCLTGHDQTNIIAGLAARSLGYARVVCLVEETDYEPLCRELGLEEILNPLRSMSRRLAFFTEHWGSRAPEETIKHDAALYTRRIETELPAQALTLPDDARVIGYYRDDRLEFPAPDTVWKSGDELVILTRGQALDKLEALFGTAT